MAKIKRSRKQITIKFENKRESANFLAAAGFKHIPAALNESGPTPHAPDLRHVCADCGKDLQEVRPGKFQCDCGASR